MSARNAEPQKLPSGRWQIRWFDARGKRKSASYAQLSQAKSALRKLQVKRDDVRSGKDREGSDQTLREVSVTWLESRAPDARAAPSVHDRQARKHASNRQHLDKHILPALGDLRLPEVTPDVVRAFVKKLEGTPTDRNGERNADVGDDGKPLPRRTLRPATIRNVVVTLRKMLKDLGYEVTASVKVPRAGYGWIRTDGEVVRFLGACGDGWFHAVASLALYAGLRRGEVAALTWHAIDFERGVIVIDRSWSGPTKSGKPRTVPLAAELATTLKLWRMRSGGIPRDLVIRFEQARKTGEARVEGLRGNALLAKLTRRACSKAKIEPVTFHQLRHTFATLMAERMPITSVKEMLGHADLATTARYAHADSAVAARDPRAQLSFGVSASADVVELRPARSEVDAEVTPIASLRKTGTEG